MSIVKLGLGILSSGEIDLGNFKTQVDVGIPNFAKIVLIRLVLKEVT